MRPAVSETCVQTLFPHAVAVLNLSNRSFPLRLVRGLVSHYFPSFQPTGISQREDSQLVAHVTPLSVKRM